MNRLFLVFSTICCLGFLVSAPVYADIYSNQMRADPDIFIPILSGRSVTIDLDESPPFEINLKEVQFIQNSAPVNLGDRVDRLVQGITVDIPPEIDIYGYEIRRYMQGIGNMKIYTDNGFLRSQYVNAKKANVILNYWRQYLKSELMAVEEIIKGDANVSSAVRTSYKQNLVTVNNFLSVAQIWIDSNLKLMQYLDSMEGQYTVSYPDIEFKQIGQADKFHKLMKKRQTALLELRHYTIFRQMVY